MDWVHLHLALNHLPVLGTPFVLLLLLWSWWRKQPVTGRFSLWLFVVLSAASIAVKYTGDFAWEKVQPQPGFDPALVERHEQAADQATTGVFLLGIAAAVALYVSRAGRASPVWARALVAVMAVATCLLMARTANFGGHIRHPEIRPATAPMP